MGAERIIFLRHGLTDFNVERRFQGIIDRPLNDSGRQQARDAAFRLPRWLHERATQVTFSELPSVSKDIRVVSSPLQRAHETAEILKQALVDYGMNAADVVTDDRLIERCYGVMEGLTMGEAKERYSEWVSQWRSTGECAPADIEDSAAVGCRVAEAAEEYSAQLAEGGTVVFVSHGGAITRGIVTLLGLSPLQFDGLRGLENCHWSELVFVGGGGTGAAGEPSWRLGTHNYGVASMASDIAI